MSRPVAAPAPAPAARPARISSVRGQDLSLRDDQVAVEEPLEVRVRHGPISKQEETTLGVTMRTPGHDFELAVGLLHSEGVISDREDVVHVGYCADENEKQYYNVVLVELDPAARFDPTSAERSYLRTSACGVCGRASLESLAMRKPPRMRPDGPQVSDAALRALPQKLRASQEVFAATGGLHAAALFDAEGNVTLQREDVGRHNAVDKLVGAEFMAGRLPCAESGLMVSGRASYEIMQKALAAGIPVVAAVGAPSSLAVDVAREFGQTLVGFLRADGYNIYSNPGRVRGLGRQK